MNMPVIDEAAIEQVRERTDIASLIGEYIPLKRAGVSLRGRCPFHNERTPSFYVHPARQFFHCFGCHESGDVIAFLMKIEGHAFPEALGILAERAGITLSEHARSEDPAYRQRRAHHERLAAQMEAAVAFYQMQLRQHRYRAAAEQECTARQLSQDIIETFRLGYAPLSWDELETFLRSKHASPADAQELGLTVPRRSGQGAYDRFRHRLMFPIRNLQGQTIAFSGRALPFPEDVEPPREERAKYINSPDSPLYHKGSILYGLYEGRVEIRRQGWALICEGNFDLIALHQAGFQNAVAPMGTALTQSQARQLARLCERAVVVFDGDQAGRRAAIAALPIFQEARLSAKVVTLPPGSDPDQFLRQAGPDALRARIEGAPGIVEFAIDVAAEETAGAEPTARARAIEDLGPTIARTGSPVEARLYIERIARRFGIGDLESIRRQLRQGLRASRNRPKEARSNPNTDHITTPPSPTLTSMLPHRECEIIGAILDNPSLCSTNEAKDLDKVLTNDDLRAIFHTASNMVETTGKIEASSLLAKADGNSARPWLAERLAIHRYDAEGAIEVVRRGVLQLRQQKIESTRAQLERDILEALRRGETSYAEELMRKRDQLYSDSRGEPHGRTDTTR